MLTRWRLLVFLCPLVWAVPAHAQGPGSGACFTVDARNGVPFTAEGRVVGFTPGQGYTVDTREGQVVVHGIGSARFWADEDVPRPEVGDTIKVDGYRIDCGAGEENLATTVTSGDHTVQVRDSATGLPRWRRRGGG